MVSLCLFNQFLIYLIFKKTYLKINYVMLQRAYSWTKNDILYALIFCLIRESDTKQLHYIKIKEKKFNKKIFAVGLF